jgi:phage terminase large subunit
MTTLDSEAGSKIREWREHPAQMVEELFGVKPDAWQADALEAYPHCPLLAMRACTGPGKQEPCDKEIETPSGRRRFGDLRPGDFVFAEDGSPTRVLSIHPQGIKPVMRLTFDDGSSCVAGPEHLWKVRGRTERRHKKLKDAGKWTKASEAQCVKRGFMTPDDGWSVLTTEQIVAREVRLSSHNGRAQFEIPRQGAAQFPHAIQPLDPYLVGIWIGDGSKNVASYCKPYLEVEDEIRRRGYSTYRRSDGKQVDVRDAIDKFRQLECFCLGSHERFIPEGYKYASIAQRQDLLCGLMDADGCIGKDGHMEFNSTSQRLAEDVIWLVRSLGGVAVMKESVKHGRYRAADGEMIECRDCWRVTVVLRFNPFRVHHKAERWSNPLRAPNTARYLTRFITEIEPAGEADCMCIEVEHPSHCYLTNDFIVTHNTAALSWIAWNFLLTRPYPYIGATSITGENLKAVFWTELGRWHAKNSMLQKMFTKTKTVIYHKEAPETWKLEARSWAKDADAEQIGNTLAGIHAEYVMWLLDETGDYPDAVMPACEAIFSGNPKEAHIVQAGNPTRRSGPLYRAVMDRTGGWKVITITADPDDPKRTPRVSVEHARRQIALWGRENPWVKVKIFGEFPDSDVMALIGPDEVEAAQKRYYRAHEIGNAPKILGVDVARSGLAASAICLRQGIQCFPIKKHRNLTSTQGAGLVSRTWAEVGAHACFVDATGGFGAGWVDNLNALGRAPIGIQFSGKPHNANLYYNKRAEMYFDAVQWIKRGGALPESQELFAVLTQTMYSHQRDKLLLEPKEDIEARLGYSLDEADSFVLTFAEPVSVPDPLPSGRQNAALADYNPYAEQDQYR